MARLTRDQRKAETRARLLGAARVVVAKRGLQAATVEEIAAEAGLTTGAIYSNFGGKDELVLAAVDEVFAADVRDYTELFARGRNLDERARAGADRWMEILRERPDYFPLYVELWTASLRSPELSDRVATRFAAMREAIARLIEAGAADLGVEVPDDFAERMGTVVNALGNGLAMEKLADPDAVPDDLFGWTLSLLFVALAREAAAEVAK